MITVSYTELNGSPREYLVSGYAEVERQLLCDWKDRITLCRELLGYWTAAGYYPPDLYDAQGNEPLYNVYAYEANVEPVPTPPSETGSSYKKAKVTVRYKVLDQYTVGDDNVFITEHIEPASEFLTLTRKGLYFGTGAGKVALDEESEAPAMIIRMFDWVYTLHGVWFLGPAYYDLPGKVNNATVYSYSLDRIFPAETLLCGNPSAHREITRYGYPIWTVTYRFTYKNHGTLASPKGWNYWPRTDNADSDGIDFERITDGTNNVPIYTLADFSQVIR